MAGRQAVDDFPTWVAEVQTGTDAGCGHVEPGKAVEYATRPVASGEH